MEKFEIMLEFNDHITKRYVRFEHPDKAERRAHLPITDLYIRKEAVGTPIPKSIKVTVEVLQLPVLEL